MPASACRCQLGSGDDGGERFAYIAAAGLCGAARRLRGGHDGETKKLLDAYAEELSVKRLEWANVFGFWDVWLRGQDLNLRPSGYGPQDDELPSPAKMKSSRQR